MLHSKSAGGTHQIQRLTSDKDNKSAPKDWGRGGASSFLHICVSSGSLLFHFFSLILIHVQVQPGQSYLGPVNEVQNTETVQTKQSPEEENHQSPNVKNRASQRGFLGNLKVKAVVPPFLYRRCVFLHHLSIIYVIPHLPTI